MLAAFFLSLRLGPVPFPISALISGLLNAALVWAALQWTSSPRLAALPLWTWLATVAALTFPGPGDDAVFSAQYATAAADRVGRASTRAAAVSAHPPALAATRRRVRGGRFLAASRASFAACRTSLTTFLAVSPKLLATVVGAFVASSAALLGLPARSSVDDVVYRLGDRTAHLALSPDYTVGGGSFGLAFGGRVEIGADLVADVAYRLGHLGQRTCRGLVDVRFGVDAGPHGIERIELRERRFDHRRDGADLRRPLQFAGGDDGTPKRSPIPAIPFLMRELNEAPPLKAPSTSPSALRGF